LAHYIFWNFQVFLHILSALQAVFGKLSVKLKKKKYPVFIDDKAAQLEKIYVNAGARGILFGIKPDELCKICEATLVDIC
jgi:prolyl-tRNA editing enzyme YbaK/EbsC (Cys-tRNA(Pro) deacylase)